MLAVACDAGGGVMLSVKDGKSLVVGRRDAIEIDLLATHEASFIEAIHFFFLTA